MCHPRPRATRGRLENALALEPVDHVVDERLHVVVREFLFVAELGRHLHGGQRHVAGFERRPRAAGQRRHEIHLIGDGVVGALERLGELFAEFGLHIVCHTHYSDRHPKNSCGTPDNPPGVSVTEPAVGAGIRGLYTAPRQQTGVTDTTPAGFEFDFELLRQLTEASGVPGYEDRVRGHVQEVLAAETDTVETDAMGNVVGTIHGNGDYEVAVAAHMDEIGFMVKHVTEDGFLKLDALGGWDPRVLRAQRVTIHTQNGDLTGLIGSVPPHTLDEEQRQKDEAVEDVVVDLGRDADDVADYVAVGDLVTMEQSTVQMGETVTGKALDDRVCVFAMLEAARRIDDPDVTIHFCATVQEEVGLRGARALGVDVDPDLAVALDVTVASDVPGVSEDKQVTELGEGAAIKLKDSSVITTPKVHRRLRSVAEDDGITHQTEVLPAGGTDTAGFQNTNGATPVGAISIPTRYLHTVTETAHGDDIDATIDLLTAFLRTETGDHDYSL